MPLAPRRPAWAPELARRHGVPATPRGHAVLELQRGAGNRATTAAVQRRERILPVLGPGDWYAHDRLLVSNGVLSTTNTFVRAARHNTLLNASGEYADISQRNDYYKALDWLLANDATFATTPVAQSIRFFRAAATVTGYTGIGGFELIPDALLVPFPDLRRLVHAVNRRLFRTNMAILSRIGTSGDVVDPKAIATVPTSAFEFDLRMVETEQDEVQAELAASSLGPAETRLLNTMVNMTVQHGGSPPRYMAWAMTVFGVTELDFTKQEHRMAIGRAMVHLAHGRSYTDFEAYVKTGSPRYTTTPIVRP